MSDPLTFTVPGEVRGKGRPRIVKIGAFSRLAADKQTASYESLVRLAAAQALHDSDPFDEPLVVHIRARLVPAASASKKARAAMLAGDQPPTKKPDLDNIVKVLDALNGVAFRDDAQIVRIRAEKVYAESAGLDVTIIPYALLRAAVAEPLPAPTPPPESDDIEIPSFLRRLVN